MRAATSVILTFLFLFLRTPLIFGDQTPLTLIYTSNTLGEVESCGCPETGDSGGLGRRSYYIDTVRKEVKTLLILDGGDALAIGLPGSEAEREKARKRSEIVLKIYEKMEYDALNIGDTDMVLGINYLKTLEESSKIPFLSANLLDKKTETPFFQPYLIKMVDGTRIGIIGLLTPDIHPFIQKELKSYFIEDPIKAALETINRYLADCDQIIALAHLNPSEIESLAKKIPQISIIIGGNDRSFIFPKNIHRSIYVQTDAFGLTVGRLNLRMVKGAREFVDVSPMRMQEGPAVKESKWLDAEGKNTYENFLTLLHSEMGFDPEIEKMISSSREQLKRPLP